MWPAWNLKMGPFYDYISYRSQNLIHWSADIEIRTRFSSMMTRASHDFELITWLSEVQVVSNLWSLYTGKEVSNFQPMIVPSTAPVKMSKFFRSNVQLIISNWCSKLFLPGGKSLHQIISSSSSSPPLSPSPAAGSCQIWSFLSQPTARKQGYFSLFPNLS